MVRSAEYGAVVSVATVVQVPPPAGLIWKATLAVSASGALAASVTLPEIGAPGSASVTFGGVESTVIATGDVVMVLPARSVTTASTVCAPLGVDEGSQASVHGAAAIVPTGVPSTRMSTVATPLPPSAGLTARVVLEPPTVAPGAGPVTDPDGAVLSTRVVTTFDVTT